MKSSPNSPTKTEDFPSIPKKRKTENTKPTTPTTTKNRTIIEDDYVTIQSNSPIVPMELTERQKEKMKERPVVPVTYTSIDQSQDPNMFPMLDDEVPTKKESKQTGTEFS